MPRNRRRVYIETETAGSCFATVGVIRDARDGRKLLYGPAVPYTFAGSAVERAESLAAVRGWVVVPRPEA